MIDFPVNPTDGFSFIASNGVVYKWVANPGVWLSFSGASPSSSGISVLQFIPENLWAAIANYTSTDDVTAYLMAAVNSGASELEWPAGKYRMTGDGAYLFHPGNQRWRGAGIGKTIIEKDGGLGIVRAMGTIDPATTYTLMTDAPAGSYTTRLTAGQSAFFNVGDVVQIVDESVMLAGGGNPLGQKTGEFVTITENYQPFPPDPPIVYPSDTLSFKTPIQYDYVAGGTRQARLVRYNWLYGVEIVDMSFTHVTYEQGTAAIVYCGACFEPRIMNCSAYHGKQQGFAFGGCYGARVDIEAHDLKSGTNLVVPGVAAFGYGVIESGPNIGGQFNINAHRVRHAYTTGGNMDPATSSPAVDTPYGIPTSSVITGVASDTHMSAWDTHPEGYDIKFNGVVVSGAGHSGIQMRCRHCSVVGATIDRTIGAAVFIPASASDAYVGDVIASNTNNGINIEDLIDWREHGAVEDYGVRTRVDGMSIQNCGGPGINAIVNTKDPSYRNVRIHDPCRFTTTNRRGISAGPMTATSLRVDGVDILCSDANMEYGIYANNSTLVALLTGVRSIGATLGPMLISTQTRAWGNLINGPLSFGTQSVATISGGVLDITKSPTGMIGILPETAGSPDDLDTIIANVIDHTILIRKAGVTAENITLKQDIGSGNIFTSTGADVLMASSTKVYMLTRIAGGHWIMLSVS